MEQSNQIAAEKMFLISRRITWVFFISFIPAGIMAFLVQNFNQTWLEIVIPWLFGIACIFIIASWIMPGIFVLFRVPWLARAWLKGITPRITLKSWEEYSRAEVFSTYFWSIFYFGCMVLGIIGFVYTKFPK